MHRAHTLTLSGLVAIMTLLFVSAAEAACDLPTNLTNLSQCKGSGRDVVIASSGACSAVKVDRSFTGSNALGTVTIDKGGRLYVPDQTLQIEVDKIEIAGLFQARTASCPIGTLKETNQVTITFTGARPCASGDCAGNNKGIFVNVGGQLQLFGLKGTKQTTQSWTYLG